jgi:hypothetical protein
MNSGPSPEDASSPSPKREVPGEFVSEDLRADCGRFLEELRSLIRLRRALPPEGAASVPGSDAAPDARVEGREGSAQLSPNSRSAHLGQ